MKASRVFTGDIKKCIKYEEHSLFSLETYIGEDCIGCDSFGHTVAECELYKENAVLIEFNGGYVDLDNLKTIKDYISAYGDVTKDGFYIGGLIMPTSPHACDSLFVDSESLKPYQNKDNKRNISARQLRKEFNCKK